MNEIVVLATGMPGAGKITIWHLLWYLLIYNIGPICLIALAITAVTVGLKFALRDAARVRRAWQDRPWERRPQSDRQRGRCLVTFDQGFPIWTPDQRDQSPEAVS